ncbi:putative target of rapamycin (TOR) kinase 1 [Trypanosoma cruzi]|uniref:Putative target of rapamycin (TOR) kinase 1 n=1 Tax=Trypanosoma cruzi TaxID=5693 RepID=A0A2V2UVG6_TRYCR|nr:putative target of rapamycin (TOR) kinase 1 [Trypanosoma cruzi]
MPALNSSTIAGMEVVASRFLYAAAILCTRLCDYYFSIKAVRRRLSALHQGVVLETSTANLLPSAVGFGERLRHIKNTIVGESSIPRKRHRPPSSRMRRSMDGEPFLFHNQSKLKLPEGNGRGSLSHHAGGGTSGTLSLIAFSVISPSTMDVWVDNTSLQGAANKGSSKSHAMTWELQRICLLTLAECGQLLPTCGRQTTPQTAYHAVVCSHFGSCEGDRRGLVAGGPQSLPLRK